MTYRPSDELYEQPIPLREGVTAYVRIPVRLSTPEALKIAAVIQALAIDSEMAETDTPSRDCRHINRYQANPHICSDCDLIDQGGGIWV